MMANEEETKPRNPRALEEAFERYTAPIGGAPAQKLPRAYVTFTVDHAVCAPGVFDEDFDLTLASLTPSMEIEAGKVSKGDPIAMAYAMARMSIVAFNGQPLGPGRDEWLWRALDQKGRQLVVGTFAQVGAPGDAAVGKALETLKVH